MKINADQILEEMNYRLEVKQLGHIRGPVITIIVECLIDAINEALERDRV